MMCRWTLLHCEQANVRNSPHMLGSIAVNFIGESQAVHCGPWFCASSMCWSPQLGALSSPSKPSGSVRIERVRCSDPSLNVIAPGALKQPVFKANWSWWNPFQHHTRLAAGTARTFNRGQQLLGWAHDASLRWSGGTSQTCQGDLRGRDDGPVCER